VATTYDELFRSILAMDSYNRGDQGLRLSGPIGDATSETFSGSTDPDTGWHWFARK
jgi:hypothetical protein